MSLVGNIIMSNLLLYSTGLSRTSFIVLILFAVFLIINFKHFVLHSLFRVILNVGKVLFRYFQTIFL